MEKVLSLKNAAESANISLSTLKRLISSGALRKVRVSEKRVGIFENDLDEYLRSRLETVDV
jgi:excisionase family DNA binding protein